MSATPQPLFDRVVVARIPPDQVTDSGIVIPDVAQAHTGRALVIEVGPEVKFVEVGDEVVISQYAGVDLTVGGDDFLVVREKEIVVRFDLGGA